MKKTNKNQKIKKTKNSPSARDFSILCIVSHSRLRVALIVGAKEKFDSSLWHVVRWQDIKLRLPYRLVRLSRSRTARYGCSPEGVCRISLLA